MEDMVLLKLNWMVICMNDKTLKIIAVCKGWGHYTDESSTLEALTNFFSDLYGHPTHFYTYEEVERIMRNALYDYIDHCDRPSDVLRDMYSMADFDESQTLVERIYMVFATSMVYEASLEPKFCNGFDERFDVICDELNKRC